MWKAGTMMPQILDKARRRFATAAMAGVGVYVGVDAVLQSLPPHYSVVSDAESNLAVGPFGWVMNLNFLGRAVTTFCAVAAINRTGPASRPRRAGAALMAAGGLSSAVLAFFPTDVDTGSGLATTAVGAVHLGVASVGFLAAMAGILVVTRWMGGSPELAAAHPQAATLAAIAAAGLASLALTTAVAPDLLGLAERICLAGVLGWVLVVCAAIRRLPGTSGPEPLGNRWFAGGSPLG